MVTRRAPAGQAVLLGHVTEAEWTNQVIDLAKLNGWIVHHSRAAPTRSGGWSTALQGSKGLPDIIAVRAPRVLFVELKSERGRLEPEQVAWRDALLACPGVEYRLWRPRDFPEVREVLAR